MVLASALAAAATGSSELLSYESGASPYSGVGRYEGATTCTAFFLDTGPVPPDVPDAPAYALTTAGCAAVSGRVVFNYFHDSAERRVVAPVVRAVYTAPGPDSVAVLELAAFYVELTDQLIRPLRVPFFSRAAARDPVAIVGAPLWPGPGESFLRAVRCRIDALVPLITRCGDVRPGAAGSPVVSLLDRVVVAVITTPAVSAADVAHAAPVTGLANCFDRDRRFDLRAADCPLAGRHPA